MDIIKHKKPSMFEMPLPVCLEIAKRLDNFSFQEIAKVNERFSLLYADKSTWHYIFAIKVPKMIEIKLQQRSEKQELIGKNILRGDGIAPGLLSLRNEVDMNFRRSLLAHRMMGRPTREQLLSSNIILTDSANKSAGIASMGRKLEKQFIANRLAHTIQEHRLVYDHKKSIEAWTAQTFEQRRQQVKMAFYHTLLRYHFENRPSILLLESEHILNDRAYIARTICPAIRPRITYYEKLGSCRA